MSRYKDGQNLCSSSFIKHWSHIVNSYVLSIIWTWLWLMQVCTVTSKDWMVTCWQCSVPSRWVSMAWPTAGGEFAVSGVGRCSCAGWFRDPYLGLTGRQLHSWCTSQAENLAPSCCLILFPNSQCFCTALNLSYFPACVPLQNFGWASSPSWWSWADCMRMRHLAGSPPEQEGWILAEFPMSSLGKSVGCSGSLLQFWPILKKDSQK